MPIQNTPNTILHTQSFFILFHISYRYSYPNKTNFRLYYHIAKSNLKQVIPLLCQNIYIIYVKGLFFFFLGKIEKKKKKRIEIK